MRTTLVINDRLMRSLKAIAADRRTTLSAVVEAFLRQGVEREAEAKRSPIRKLPSFKAGKIKVDISDRDALYRAMESD